jgi:hypothetical protein
MLGPTHRAHPALCPEGILRKGEDPDAPRLRRALAGQASEVGVGGEHPDVVPGAEPDCPVSLTGPGSSYTAE